ncbi:5205_t:CDS:2 [Ambispora leptoticha]|uniref:5205_t:CDS:1 n=1 Tax=Ambispora leptoticha TaxID=144679 RepID=A0A9N9DDJ0_9GLOM|nr:5205_t:CDS:2 [Ambispora leptoticha]
MTSPKGEIKVKKEDLKVGQRVRYHPVGLAMQTTDGIIKEIITEPEIAGRQHETHHRVAHDKGQQSRIKLNNIKVGQYVIYHPIGSTQQTAEGIVKEIITADEVAGQAHRTVHATPEHPRVLIENLHTHKETAYKPESIERIISEEEAMNLAGSKRGRGKKVSEADDED